MIESSPRTEEVARAAVGTVLVALGSTAGVAIAALLGRLATAESSGSNDQ